MRSVFQAVFAILLVFLFVEIWLGFPRHLETKSEDTPTESNVAAGPQEAGRKMQGVHLVESQAGARDWELFADSAVGTEGKGTWDLKTVKVHFFSEKGVQFTVTGDTGRIDTKTKDIEIRGKVVTKSSNGYQFFSPSVSFESQKRILRSPEKVKMIGPSDEQGTGLVLEGESMETSMDDSLMKIHENVVASKKFRDGKKFKITSQNAEFSGKSNLALFKEQVAIQLDSMKMEGPEAQFQYRSGSDFLQSILVKGGVRVSDFDKYATSDSVRFDPLDNRYILSGNPRVVQNNDEIFGEQITLIDGGRKVRVEKVKARVEKNLEQE